jgi:hypothetical protein
MKSIQKLIEISSEPITNRCASISDFSLLGKIPERTINELLNLLREKNGFLAFESALLIMPSIKQHCLPGISDWNAPEGWRRYYEHIDRVTLFFAQDIFAGQFGITSDGIIRLDPETGEVSEHSNSLEDWASKILSNYDYETGWSVGKKWQGINGSLSYEYRLLGKVPFVLGGDYKAENLVKINIVEAMEKLGRLNQQIKGIPDGEKITIKGWIT